MDEGIGYTNKCADITNVNYLNCCCTLQEPEVHWSQLSSDTELHRQRKKSDKILCQFSEICVRSIVDRPNVNLEEVISAMKALGYLHVANLLTRCFNGTQVHINTRVSVPCAALRNCPNC